MLKPASIKVSNHFNPRPDEQDISLLVIHNISLPAGQFATSYVEDLFLGQLDIEAHPSFVDLQGLRVSAHLFIRRDGEVIQFVPFNQRAWHAGVSSFAGRENCNDFSIGIEMEGTDDLAYTSEQYSVLIAVTDAIQKAYPKVTHERICGHCDIAPGRKTDPGKAFDWQRFLSALEK
ncbi:1,6-anhydro-N-acetylmuramyl-L-alanine amidase AmpD [Saccharobesus litoralis]|uniref:1,6-anhydro-N-acetylmuramyl-L-alanine amidase AmpD n=1 Tax=Saccharobesus litoralis TaxID=2172099 RepID=A0A2S0VY13_9ALTE|nr:1,6-anhydro-N-acetylmuramyl-L-alanine amidase AmpD [Saccharobesus litoralis]